MASRVKVQTLESLLRQGERQENGCLFWMRGKSRQGYGYVSSKGRVWRVSRLTYVLSGGVLNDGDVVRHTCDQPPCFEPTHLLSGRLKDNAQDAVTRGRHPVGFLNGRAKLTPIQVSEIRERDGESQNMLAREFGVCQATIWNVLRGKHYVRG